MTALRIRRRARRPGEGPIRSLFFGVAAWAVALVFVFPIAWMVLNSFKQEADANGGPTFIFTPTLDRYRDVVADTSGLLGFQEALANSLWAVGVSTLLVMALAIPAAYALAVRPIPRARDALLFLISTKFLPVVAAILPLWLIARDLELLNTRFALIVLYTAMNLPLAVWMLRSFFLEVPRELVEAAEIDGASLITQIRSVILPIAVPGIAATALLCVIFAWNEFFLAVQLNPVDASTIPVWVAGNAGARGGAIAELSAAATLATLPVILAGWVVQKRMIRGLTMGAVK